MNFSSFISKCLLRCFVYSASSSFILHCLQSGPIWREQPLASEQWLVSNSLQFAFSLCCCSFDRHRVHWSIWELFQSTTEAVQRIIRRIIAATVDKETTQRRQTPLVKMRRGQSPVFWRCCNFEFVCGRKQKNSSTFSFLLRSRSTLGNFRSRPSVSVFIVHCFHSSLRRFFALFCLLLILSSLLTLLLP